MTGYTEDAPFRRDEITAWREDGDLRIQYPPREASFPQFVARMDAVVAHALIEAESDTWHWTGPGRTHARKRRWVASFGERGPWVMHHDDFPDGWAVGFNETYPFGRQASAQLREFQAWKSAQDRPAEPTGLGAVVEVDGQRWCRADTGLWWSDRRGVTWANVLRYGPVTVLSEGVTSS